MGFAVVKRTSGKCEQLDRESLSTAFVILWPILIPVETIYSHWKRSGNPTSFPVRLHAKSVALAYLRWVVWPIALFVTLIVSVGPSHSDASPIPLALLLLAWPVWIFATGRVHGRTASQRRVLAIHVGHAAPPELLFDESLEFGLEDIDKLWNGAARSEPSYRTSGGETPPWRELVPNDVPERLLALYYAACRYEAVLTESDAMNDRANLAWRRLEDLFPTFEALRTHALTTIKAARAARTLESKPRRRKAARGKS